MIERDRKAASKKAAATNLKKFGKNYYAVIGAMGGSVKVPKGYAIKPRKVIEAENAA